MSDSLVDIENSILELKKSIEDTKKFKNKLELNKSDLLRYLTLSEQKMKSLRSQKAIPVLSIYRNIHKSYRIAINQVAVLDTQIKAINKSIEQMCSNLEKNSEILEGLKKELEPKVIPFRREDEQ